MQCRPERTIEAKQSGGLAAERENPFGNIPHRRRLGAGHSTTKFDLHGRDRCQSSCNCQFRVAKRRFDSFGIIGRRHIAHESDQTATLRVRDSLHLAGCRQGSKDYARPVETPCRFSLRR
ncbi:MAG: hypothetical protein ACK559_00055, partial [bacterium]